MPLKVQDRTIGVLKIENKKLPSGELAAAFSKEDEEVLTILANVIAVTFENQRLAEERRTQAEHDRRTISARLCIRSAIRISPPRVCCSSLQNSSLPSGRRRACQTGDGVLPCRHRWGCQ